MIKIKPRPEPVDHMVPQTFAHQLVARLLIGLGGLLWLEAAKAASKLGSELLKTATGPAAKLPPVSTPAQRRQAREAAKDAELKQLLEEASAEEAKRQAGTTGTVVEDLCNVRFEDSDGAWWLCNTLPASPGEYHRHRHVGADATAVDPGPKHPNEAPETGVADIAG